MTPPFVMQEIKLVIFDLAGTVIEDSGEVPEAFTAALKNHGIEVTTDSIREMRGASKREIIRSYVGGQPGDSRFDVLARTEEIYDSFRSILAAIYEKTG